VVQLLLCIIDSDAKINFSIPKIPDLEAQAIPGFQIEKNGGDPEIT